MTCSHYFRSAASLLMLTFVMAVSAYAQEADLSQQAPAPAADAPSDPFTITDVKVDITADSAAHARDKAFTDAEQQAFTTLAARLEPDHADARKPSDADLAALVQDVELSSERTSAVRYIGVFTIRFRPEETKQYFGMPQGTASSSNSDPAPAVAPQAAMPPSTLDQQMKTINSLSMASMTVSVPLSSLAQWLAIKQKFEHVQALHEMTIDALSKNEAHVTLKYMGDNASLMRSFADQGLALTRTNDGIWQVQPGSPGLAQVNLPSAPSVMQEQSAPAPSKAAPILAVDPSLNLPPAAPLASQGH